MVGLCIVWIYAFSMTYLINIEPHLQKCGHLYVIYDKYSLNADSLSIKAPSIQTRSDHPLTLGLKSPGMAAPLVSSS